MDVMSPPYGGQNVRQSVDISSPIEGDLDDTFPPTYRTVPTQLINQTTQPTQLLEPSSPDSLFTGSPSSPVVQVEASSPAQPLPSRKTSLLASAMAPAGTTFRRPYLPPAPNPIIINSDDEEGPTYLGGSSDSEESLLQSDIKPSQFQRKTKRVEESPLSTQGYDRFKSITANSFYQPQQPRLESAFSSSSVKRRSDDMANSYGNVSKKPRQSAPSRAVPVVIDEVEELDMDVDDISDPNVRFKTKKMIALFPKETVALCYEALMKKKGNYDDACDWLVNQTSSLGSKPKAIDLTGSDDELLLTPQPHQDAFRSGPKPILVNEARQQIKKPAISLQQKYSSTQNPVRIAPRLLAPAPKKLDVFNTPEPVVKKRTLVRGRRCASSPVREYKRPQTQTIDVDSSSDRGESDNEPDDRSFHGRLLHFFNTCTPEDLVDTAGVAKEVATYFVTKRPFRSLTQVEKVQSEKPASSKSKAKPQPIGEKIYDKCDEMLRAYEAVDWLVQKCENIAKPLAQSMSNWGVNVYGGRGEVDIASVNDSQRACHDSGIGTPVSDEDAPIKPFGKGGFFGQPISMAEDVQMKDYQIVGMNWLNLLYNAGHSCILADDMGLGKTCQVIGFLAHLCEVSHHGPHLIVVLAATVENWMKEFQRFAPGLAVELYYGSMAEREQMRYTIEESRDSINVVVTTYQIAKGKDDHPWLRNFGFNCTIFDEGHYLKNAESDVSKKLAKIKSDFRLLLTGTPLQNNLKELISLLAFLMPKMFNDKRDELQSIFTHNVKAMDANHEALLSAQRIARARSMLTPFILRRKKNQVLKDLPKKERNVVYCDLTSEQKELYDTQIARAYDIRTRRLAGEIGLNESANVLMKLRQAAIHPFLFRRLYRDKLLPGIAKQCLKDPQWVNSQTSAIVTELTAYSDMEVHHLCSTHRVLHKYALNQGEWLASGKVQQMLRLLRQWIQEGHRTLVFSQFTMVLDILEVVFSHETIDYFRLDGNTKVPERQDMIDEFCNEDNQTPVFMLSTRAGGAGINLAAANKVIVFDSGFNPQDDIQAENRAHRIGQVKDVEIVRLITRGTVEEQIYAMGLTKLKLDEQVAGDEDCESDKAKERMEMEGMKKVEELFFSKLDDEKEQHVDIKAETLDRKSRESSSDSSLSTLSSEGTVKDKPAEEALVVRPKAKRNDSQQAKGSTKGSRQSKLSFGKA